MVDPKNREMMQDFYRWIERYEEVTKMDQDSAAAFFKDAWNRLDEIIQKYDNVWAMWLAIGYYQALEAVYKEASK